VNRPLLTGAARAVLLWERLWPRLWPPLGLAGLFVALALLDLPVLLPGWLHALVVLAFAAAIGWTAWRSFRDFRPVSEAAAWRRLEKDSGLEHRPLAALGDCLAAGRGDPLAEALWAAHRRRLAAGLGRLRLAPPSPGLPGRDPRALRALVLLLLFAGAWVAGPEAPDRLYRALTPVVIEEGPPPRVDLWISPPAYTGRPVLHPAPGSAEILEIPQGSRAMAQVSGLDGAPELRLGDLALTLEDLGSGTWRLEETVGPGDRLTLIRGMRELATWRYRLLPDDPPAARFAEPPAANERGRLRLPYTAADDHGVTRLVALFHRDGEDFQVALPLSGRGRTVRGSALLDLTDHPWAGLPVQVALEAADAAGQTGRSEPVALELPERVFRHPLARYLAEQRKRLLAARPEAREEVAGNLGRLTADPEIHGGDLVIHLALGVARNRLLFGREADAVPTVRALLWSLALRLEDGGLSEAERELARQTERLRQALERGGDLDALTEDLRRSLEEFLSSLAREMRKDDLEGLAPPAGSRVIDSDFLERLIDEIAELARGGNKEGARRRLAELQAMLQGLSGRIRTPEGRAKLAEGARLMRSLKALTEKQKNLLDRTFEALRRQKDEFADRKSAPPPDRDGLAREQETLGRELSELTGKAEALLGEKPETLDRAGGAMRDAADALAAGDLDKGVEAQGKALDALRKGQSGVGGMVARQSGLLPGQPGSRPGGGMDPFGRPAGDGPGSATDPEGNVKIPDSSGFARTRAIRDELRRRAGERDRSPAERDYLERLLKRF
jgi:hypothetical protein